MNAILRSIIQIVAYGDTATGNPQQRYVDWKRDFQQLEIENPRSEAYHLAAGEEKLIFDGLRDLDVDGTTEFTAALVTDYTDRYRFTHTDGTDPGFRTDRGLNLAGVTLTFVVNRNSTVTVSRSSGTFSTVQVGDIVWLPHTDAGVTSPFDLSNRGFWTVLSTGSTLVLERDGDFDGYGEAVAVTDADQFVAYSSDGVQVGDTLEISAGFVASTRRSFPIVAVTPWYLEVSSNPAVPAQVAIPGASGFIVYTDSKRFLHIEADQECLVLLNGDTGSTSRLSPWIAGDAAKPGVFHKTGPVWSLSVVNRSSRSLNITIVSAE